MMEFTFGESSWDLALDALCPGESISAARCLALMEEMTEDAAEEALLDLEEKGITLDISDLPQDCGGQAALRLRQEQQLAEQGNLLDGLEENDPLRLYLQELSQLPAAGDGEVLARQYISGDDTVLQNLVNLHLGLVVERSCTMTGRGVLLLDLIQEGSFGLWQGILHYTDGNFADHIRWWVDQYLAKAVLMQARTNGVGQKMRQGMEDYRDMDQRLLSELGRNPTLEEIAEAIHVTSEEAEVYRAMIGQARSRQQIEAAREPRQETPEDEQAVENTAYFAARQRILEMLSTLPPQQAQVLTLRFGLEGGLPLTPQQTGEKLGITGDEVLKLETAALAVLRQQEG